MVVAFLMSSCMKRRSWYVGNVSLEGFLLLLSSACMPAVNSFLSIPSFRTDGICPSNLCCLHMHLRFKCILDSKLRYYFLKRPQLSFARRNVVQTRPE
jgi:hypothetical protein